RGAVGTSASYVQLLNGSGSAETLEKSVLDQFGLQAREISTQTYPRKLDYLLLSTLAGLGASLSKFAADIRILSSPEFGEVFEPFAEKQVGSSAMPFKRNPILCERMGSLARMLPAYADVAWQNTATNYLERTLDDSANRRTILPEALLCADEIVQLAIKVVNGLTIEPKRIADNLKTYGPFAGTESVLLEAVRAGGDRQDLHEVLRTAAMQSWKAIAQGKENPLGRLLTEEPELTNRLDPAEIRRMLEPAGHTGSAAARARALAVRIDQLSPFPEQKQVGVA
ncbi:MAG TPA: lyase family protein, partial [Candidatus Rubrimentiphilum sp.]|nr:lyase family protein [Candidatus Rubrimentiphilum sp.]